LFGSFLPYGITGIQIACHAFKRIAQGFPALVEGSLYDFMELSLMAVEVFRAISSQPYNS
jgi:predicted secreted protein